MTDFRQYAPATERNRQPILDVLETVLPKTGSVLEISSGTGEHITFFAPRLKYLTWVASEPQVIARQSIQAWADALPSENLQMPPLDLDVAMLPWPVEQVAFQQALPQPITAIININMIHISAWQMCEQLMAGAGRILPPQGVLYLYGPYRRNGQHTAPSNEAFDASLRDRDPSWGIRDLEAVVAAAEQQGLLLKQVVEMPANNLSVIFERGA
jgi:SAM-dependent methyltransferase